MAKALSSLLPAQPPFTTADVINARENASPGAAIKALFQAPAAAKLSKVALAHA